MHEIKPTYAEERRPSEASQNWERERPFRPNTKIESTSDNRNRERSRPPEVFMEGLRELLTSQIASLEEREISTVPDKYGSLTAIGIISGSNQHKREEIIVKFNKVRREFKLLINEEGSKYSWDDLNIKMTQKKDSMYEIVESMHKTVKDKDAKAVPSVPVEQCNQMLSIYYGYSEILENAQKYVENRQRPADKGKVVDSDMGRSSGDIVAQKTNLEGVHPEEKRVLERRKRIDDLLKRLPKELPTLSDLPRKEWWRLFIDQAHHKDAEIKQHFKGKDPGKFYDTDMSPGYYRSMMELFDRKLAVNDQKKMNYEGYTELHNLATKYVEPDYKREGMRELSGFDRIIGSATVWHKTFPEDGPEREEAFATFKEISEESINGLPLFRYSSSDNHFGGKGITVGYLAPLSKGVPGLGREGEKVAREEKKVMNIRPLYKVSEGPGIMNSVLKSYYDGKEKPGQTRDERLGEIARVVRNAAIIHQKHDGNGRSAVYGMMNMFLSEEGFCPAIIPERQDIFGGRKTIDGLKESMLLGMHTFIKEVGKYRQGSNNDNPESMGTRRK